MDKINDSINPVQSPSLISRAEYPQTQYIQSSITLTENMNENKLTYANCNICSTFKGEGRVRQLCGKYACMKN